MNKQYIISAILAVLISLSFGASAQQGHFSLGLGIGNSQFDLNEAGLVSTYTTVSPTSTFSDSVTSLSLFAGYQFDEYLSLESDLIVVGDVTATDAGLVSKLFDVSTLSLVVALSKQVSTRSRLFARLGAHLWYISESNDATTTIDTAVDLTYGLGLDFNLYGDRSRQFRLQWNHYDYDGVFINSGNIFSVNLLFLIGVE